MSVARPDLHIVSTADEPRPRAVAPETDLKRLFRREARLEADLIETRRQLAAARTRYARKHLLLMLPGLDHLRRLFMPATVGVDGPATGDFA